LEVEQNMTQAKIAQLFASNNTDELNMAKQLQFLVTEVKSLRSQLEKSVLNNHSNNIIKEQPALLKISLDRVHGERKPYILRFDGELQGECKLSSMRAAIFLVLLIDLQDRCENGTGFSDTMQEVLKVYKEFDSAQESSENVVNLVRVGLYRFEFSLDGEEMFNGPKLKLNYKSSAKRLELIKINNSIDEPNGIIGTNNITLTISSSDTGILSIIDEISRGSPLTRLRRQKSIYVSSGAKGWEQLFLEYFEHKYKVRNTSMFYRPALPTYPDEILKLLDVGAATIKRKQVMLEGYQSGRVEFVEILLRQTLWDLITIVPGKGFKLYPPSFTTEHVKAHLEEMINQVSSYPNYNLILTDAPFPFILGVVELFQENFTECFTMFYRQHIDESDNDWTCFVLNDRDTAKSVLDNVTGSVLAHPSTITNPSLVKDEIKKVLNHLQVHGPKKQNVKRSIYAA
jgi:hypothetical protein